MDIRSLHQQGVSVSEISRREGIDRKTQRSDILRRVLRHGLDLAAVGASLGLAGALIVSHLMASLLYGVSPYDLSIFAGVAAVLTAVAIAASYVPALRAMRLDPITTLHAE